METTNRGTGGRRPSPRIVPVLWIEEEVMSAERVPFPLWVVLLSLAVCVWTPSCAPRTVSNVAVGEVLEGEAGEFLDKDYIIKDRSLARDIAVLDVTARYVGDFLDAQAVVKNRRNTTVAFEYAVDWFDEEGFPIDTNIRLWKPDLLYGAETKWITAICPKPHARGFKFMIRKPHPVAP